jgi:hypothetical protein
VFQRSLLNRQPFPKRGLSCLLHTHVPTYFCSIPFAALSAHPSAEALPFPIACRVVTSRAGSVA